MTANEVAQKLKPLRIIRGFPREPEEIELLAEVIAEWFIEERFRDGGKKYDAEQQLDLLVKFSVRWIEAWRGIPQLEGVMRELFPQR